MKRDKFRNGGQILYIPTELVRENPLRPRIYYSNERMTELCASVAVLGIIEPLTVIYDPADVYVVISGERRLRAARLLRMPEVPCVLVEQDGHTASLISLAENTQRTGLHFFEIGLTLERIRDVYGLTYPQLAEETGFSLQEIRAKVRLLSIPPALRRKVVENGLTERFALLLVRHTDPEKEELLRSIVEERLTLSEAKTRSDRMLRRTSAVKKVCRRYYKDGTVFINTIDHAVEEMTKSGLGAVCEKTDTEECVEYNIRIPKKVRITE